MFREITKKIHLGIGFCAVNKYLYVSKTKVYLVRTSYLCLPRLLYNVIICSIIIPDIQVPVHIEFRHC